MQAIKAYKDLKRNKYRNLFQDRVYKELRVYMLTLRILLFICLAVLLFGLYMLRIVYTGGYFTDPYKPYIGTLKGEDIVYDGDKTFPAYAVGLAEMDLPDGTEVVLYVHGDIVIKGFLKSLVDPAYISSLCCILAPISSYFILCIMMYAVSRKNRRFANMRKYLLEDRR